MPLGHQRYKTVNMDQSALKHIKDLEYTIDLKNVIINEQDEEIRVLKEALKRERQKNRSEMVA